MRYSFESPFSSGVSQRRVQVRAIDNARLIGIFRRFFFLFAKCFTFVFALFPILLVYLTESLCLTSLPTSLPLGWKRISSQYPCRASGGKILKAPMDLHSVNRHLASTLSTLLHIIYEIYRSIYLPSSGPGPRNPIPRTRHDNNHRRLLRYLHRKQAYSQQYLKIQTTSRER